MQTTIKKNLQQQRDQLHKIVLMLGYNELCPSIENAIILTFDKLKINLVTMTSPCIKDTLKCTQSKTITQLVKLCIQKPEFIFKFNFLLTSKSNVEIILNHLSEHQFRIPNIVVYNLNKWIDNNL